MSSTSKNNESKGAQGKKGSSRAAKSKAKKRNYTSTSPWSKCTWSTIEKDFLGGLICERIREKKRRLNAEDWCDVVKLHNERFRGHTMPKGTLFPSVMTRKGKGPRHMSLPKKLARAQTLGDRSVEAIKDQLKSHWPDVKQMIKTELQKLDVTPLDDNKGGEDLGSEDDEDEEREGDDESSGGELDAGFEDPNKMWVAQQAATAPNAGGLSHDHDQQEVKYYDGIKYERKQNDLFPGKLVSQPQLFSIDGEDYVEYRVLRKRL